MTQLAPLNFEEVDLVRYIDQGSGHAEGDPS
ncbi:hypothetical protein DO70_1150 [Burkholderia pseudomallei]|nr:hypothetical protein DO70_1150 [Burkholderia pseudomallei]